MLQNKFYIGVVTYKGVEYPGLHEPIVDQSLFQRVQETLRARDQAGERKRKHPHYLRGTLYCGECGAKMSSLTAKGQYLYFYCLGQKKHNGCSQRYIDADRIETAIENLYKNMRISPAWQKKLRTSLEKEIVARSASSLRERKRLTKKVDELTGKRYKLIEIYYAEAINMEMLKAEQTRLGAEIMLCEERLKTLDARAEQGEKVLELAITLASRCGKAYLKAKPETRRLFNQAFFDGIYVKDGQIQKAQYTELFALLFSPRGLNKDNLVDLVEHYSNSAHLVEQLRACCAVIARV